jgi:hypothetical protein
MDTRTLRKFGITMCVALAIFGGLALWRDKASSLYLFGASAFFLVCAVILPRALVPIEWAWMKFGHYMGLVMTTVLLTLTFYLMITPLGLLMRLFGKDLLERKFDKNAKSYWYPVETDGPCSRPDKPY